MLSNKSPLLFSSFTNWSPLCCTHSLAPQKTCRRQTRSYASHLDDADLLKWPVAVHPHTTPTPYQILRCPKGGTYTKNHFYTLVKLYHPDQCHPSLPTAQLPLHIRLERYRMLVAAHDILSDVDKRKAYDAWGHGWVGHHNTPTTPCPPSDWHFDHRRWATDPRNNATWEDWERWYHDNNGTSEPPGRTVQMSNVAFVTLLFALVSVGGVIQGTRFNAFNGSAIERREAVHRDAVMQLNRSKHATMNGDRDERVRTFLEHREAQLAGEESYHRLLPPAKSCAVVEVKKQ